MPITRCTEQSGDSLEEFYQLISENKAYDRTGVGDAMLQLLEAMNNLFKQTQLWGVTSHARLILVNANDTSSNWYVTVSSVGSGAGYAFYRIDYLLPLAKRPWQYAQVTGEVDTLAQAINHVLIAMRESEGWVGNEELTRLLSERNL